MKTTHRHAMAGGFELLEQRYSPGFSLPWHCHNRAELCFLFEGALREVIAGSTLRYAPYDAVFKPAGARHRVEVSARGARCLVVCVPDERFDGIAGRRDGQDPARFHGGQLLGLCANAIAEMESRDEFSPLVLEGLALQMLGEIARAGSARPQDNRPRWLDRIRERLHDEGRPRPSLRTLAADAGVSPSAVSQAFQRFEGCSVGEYLRRLHVSRARALLAEGRTSLAQVARECGFYDQSHLTRVFRRYLGVTPAVFRNQGGRSS